ncbi:MAG: hypothetical protein MZW92_02065 [Comamonadaceae bacterium]|nr:hypothetical protein [Comamonadaceae bacterium]
MPRDELKFPTPSGKIEIDSDAAEAGRAAQPAALRAEDGADRRPLHAAVRPDRRRWRTASR